jgi:hypothetical protein
MSTKAVLQDSVVVNVPSGLPYLVIRFPLLQSPSCGSDEAPSNYQLINSENILCSVDPSNVKNVQDESGNSYRELTYKNPPAGQITIQAKTGQIDIAANLSKPLPDVNLPISSNDMPSCDAQQILHLLWVGASFYCSRQGKRNTCSVCGRVCYRWEFYVSDIH